MCSGQGDESQRSISHSSVLSDELGRSVGKRGNAQCLSSGSSQLGSGGEPKSHTPEPCGRLHTVPDHLPLSPGLVSSDKESAAHILSR